jgi:hypothetical protein
MSDIIASKPNVADGWKPCIMCRVRPPIEQRKSLLSADGVRLWNDAWSKYAAVAVGIS